MNAKLVYLLLLGPSLVIAHLAGRAIAKRFVSRIPSLLFYVAGAIIFIAGLVLGSADPRFFFIAIVGLSFKVAGMGSFGKRRTFREHSVDLWAPQR